MSWQIGTLVVLLLALGGGMLWYETSRPPSQIVALVAVLAALAVAGRIVLAPIPNVVATTDIVFFAGYALGPAPGFAVGALGGLVSNFWLGQGVWTPWQMVGWGMTGVAGGVIWHLTRGRANRFTLALACGAAGLVFGAWMNFQTMVSFGGEISLDRYLVLEARAIPFDLAHITGNVIFALAAGPAMVAALRRFRERFEWQQVSSVAGVLLVAIALGTVLVAPAPAGATVSAETTSAANWLKTQQNADGGFGASPDAESSVNITARAMLGLAAAEINPLDVKIVDKTPLTYLQSRKKGLDEASDIALVILALKTVRSNPRDFVGRDLVEALRVRSGKNFSYGDKVNVAAFAALAFQSVSAKPMRDNVVSWLRSVQTEKGGWGIGAKADVDPDSTGTVLQAHPGTKSIRKAMEYLRGVQKDSGGFASGSTVNSQSTGLVVAGSIASGKGPNFLKQNGNSGLDFLLARQATDGAIWYSKSSDQTRIWVTADALPALAGASLPIGAPPRAPKPDKPADSTTGNGGSTPGTDGTTTPTYTPDLSGTGNSSPGGQTNPSGNSPTISEQSAKGAKSGGSNPGANNGATTNQGDVPPVASVPIVPVAPTEAVLTASEAGSSPSALLAILICLVVTGGLAGGTVLLARRFRW